MVFTLLKREMIPEAKQKTQAIAMIACYVKLGNIKKIGGPDSTITYHSLLMEGYDFVEIHLVTGVEFVEYDSDQVSIRKVNKHFWLGESKHRTTHSSLK